MHRLFAITFTVLLTSSCLAGVRSQKFLSQVRMFASKAESVTYAKAQIKNPESPFRIDAVEFIREIKDVGSIPFLQRYVEDRDINTFVIYALGELQAFEVTETLIGLLDHSNPNVRGNAFTALGKIYPLNLPQGYVYQQPEMRRRRHIKTIKQWWQNNWKTLQKNYTRDLHSDQAEKQKLWDKYGKKYLLSD